MNPGKDENIELPEDLSMKSNKISEPESKRPRLGDVCNNNLGNTLNDVSDNDTRWACASDMNFMEPEMLEDMGVSMLEDEEASCESIQKLQSQECTISPTSSERSRHLPAIENGNFEGQNAIYRGSSLETVSADRLGQDQFDLDDPVGYTKNESGYGSRMETDTFGDSKQSFNKDESGKSGIDQFYLYRRKKRPSIIGEDKFNKLSDEMILMILKWLPKLCLVRSMLVCKRWYQIARDEVLWSRLDLGCKVLNAGSLGHVLPRGVQILRLAQAEIADPVFQVGSEALSENYVSKLQYLDLSMAVISPNGLATLLSRCRYLRNLSLEKCTLNRLCCKAINKNVDLEILNLTMCEGIDAVCIKKLTKLQRLSVLNVSWCSLDSGSVTRLCKSLPETITRINISGCRKTITDDNVDELVSHCPNIIELDLSDCTMLTINAVQSILNLKKLEHLSLSRCYSIPPSSYLRLAYMPSLLHLNIFGLMSETTFATLQATCTDTQMNKFLFSSVARPTVGVRRTSIWGLRVRD